MFEDKTLICRDCKTEFKFTASEQEFFASRLLQNEPKRCSACRILLRARRSGIEVELFEAACDNCGTTTKVSFKPLGFRPVYCMECLHRRRHELQVQAGVAR